MKHWVAVAGVVIFIICSVYAIVWYYKREREMVEGLKVARRRQKSQITTVEEEQESPRNTNFTSVASSLQSQQPITVTRPVFLGILTVLGMVRAVSGALMSLPALGKGGAIGDSSFPVLRLPLRSKFRSP